MRKNVGRLMLVALGCVAAVFYLAGCACMEESKPAVAKPQAPKPVVISGKTCPVISREGDKLNARLALPTYNMETSDILLEKTFPMELWAGQSFTYLIKVTNLRECKMTNVGVTEHLSPNFEFEGSNPQGQLTTDGDVKWALGTLAGGASKTIEVRGKAKGKGTIEHCAEVIYTPNLCLAANVIEPKLTLTKTAPADVIVCDPIPVKMVVSNTGSGAAKNVKVTDNLPAGLTVDGKTALTFDAGTLEAGQSREFSFVAKASKTGRFDNRATATADGGLSAEATTTTTARVAVLTIAKTGTQKVFAGRPVKYDVTVGNKGDVAATNVVVKDTLPGNVTFVSASDGGSFANGEVTWNIAKIDPNGSKTLTINTTAARIGTAVNKAVASAYCVTPVAAEVSTEVAGIPAILLEVIDLYDPIEVGGKETYVITATNQGSTVGTNIAITVTLEDSQQYVSSSGLTTATVAGQVIKFAPLARLDAKAKAEWRVEVKAAKAGDVRFSVSMTEDQLTRPVQETEATNQY